MAHQLRSQTRHPNSRDPHIIRKQRTRSLYVYLVCKICTLFFGHAVLRRRSHFFSRFRRRGKQGVRRYIATHAWTPAELRGACSEHSKSLSWLFCQGVAFRLAEPARCMENLIFFLLIFNRPLRSLPFSSTPLSRTLHNIISPLFFSSVLSATMPHQPQQQQQYNGSFAPSSRLCAIHGVPATCVSMDGAQQQEIEPRQHFRVQRNNEAHVVGPHARYTKHTAPAKKNSSPCISLELPCSPSSTCYAPGIPSKPRP